ncbi:MAG: DNA polymerase III subunit alpha [bacterium]|nr:DNA polymerase III subunit alpha [bacterium]
MLKEHANFVHLHVHSQYSLLDGACRIDSLIAKAIEYRMPALAITDHGNLFGAIEFYKKALDKGIKPILGCEMYVAPTDRRDHNVRYAEDGSKEKNYHLILLAKNEKGYKNLIQLSTLAYLEGFYYKPRIDWQLLEQYHTDLIALSACLHGEIPQMFLSGQDDKAEQVAKRFISVFGKENFYLELQQNGLPDQTIVNRKLVELGKKLEIKLVATNDCHYMTRADAKAHDILLCIQTGKKVSDTERLKFDTDEFYFKSYQEIEQQFGEELKEAVYNTIEVSDKCGVKFEFNEPHLPKFIPPKNHTLSSYLEEIAREGLQRRFKTITPEIEQRLNYELEIIEKMRYRAYFLIVWDFIQFAKNRGIPVGPGRGSAAGSLVAYCLGITDIDPIKYGLIFERFLNPERVSLPDIDIDFCYRRRQEVVEYVTKKYGEKNVAQIITFGTLVARNAIRDVGRVLDLPLAEVDKLAKLVPEKASIEEAMKNVPELKELVNNNPQYQELIRIATSLQGLIRHVSTHAAGIVIAPQPLTEFLPLYKHASTQEITTQYDMDAIETIKLLKMDFLGLRTLTVISDTVKLVEKRRGIKLDLANLTYDDPAVFALFSRADTMGIFQVESPGMRDLLKKLSPSRIDDIIAILALYRPGPLGSEMIDDFIKRRHGKIAVEYPHPKLAPVLETTYGVILYQEQVMQIANILADFSMQEADELRRGIGKKDVKKIEQQRMKFILGCKKHKIDEQKARAIFDLMSHFSGYGFNKSHAAAYAIIAYQTAYLKIYYPVEYMAALLTSEMGTHDKIVLYINDCKAHGIKVLPPDVNESYADFTVVDDTTIRFGLGAVKNVGLNAIEAIIQARQEKKFTDLYDFCERVDLSVVNSRVVDSLIKCGAFDSLGANRAQLVHALDTALAIGAQRQQERKLGQTSFFDILTSGTESNRTEVKYENIPEFEEAVLLKYEKDLLGFYITGHPLATYENIIRQYAQSTTESIKQIEPNTVTSLAGIITQCKIQIGKSGKPFAIFSLEDLTGHLDDIRCFGETFDKNRSLLHKDSMVYITGKVDFLNDKLNFVVTSMLPIDQVEEKLTSSIHIRLSTVGLEDEMLTKLKSLLDQHRGNCVVYLHIATNFRNQSFEVELRTDPNRRVAASESLIAGIENLLGQGTVWLSNKG